MLTDARSAALHRTLWRWHFWAGLVVTPFLLILSLTGAIYLFEREIDNALYPRLRLVAPVARPVAASAMIRAALAAEGGAASRIDMPATPDRAAVVHVTPAAGPTLQVHVDPGSGRVLGSLDPEATLVGWANTMHGSLLLGDWGDRIVELAACWTLVLVGTGLFLWWPRGGAGVWWPRLRGQGRRFWRDLHGPVGLWTAGLIAFLVVTGLPWAGVQGDVLQRFGAATGIGYPATFRNNNAPASRLQAAPADGPWTLEAAPLPQSAEGAEHAGHGGRAPAGTGDAAAIAGVDPVVAQLARRGFDEGYRLFLPGGPSGVYIASAYPDRPEGQRTLYFDRYTLAPIGAGVGYADYGWMGRAIELGVQIHMGNYFGRANQLLMLLPCIAIWVLTVSGVTMWWKRRPQGGIGAPRAIPGARMRGVAAVLVVAGLAMPLFGASLLVLLLADRALALARRVG